MPKSGVSAWSETLVRQDGVLHVLRSTKYISYSMRIFDQMCKGGCVAASAILCKAFCVFVACSSWTGHGRGTLMTLQLESSSYIYMGTVVPNESVERENKS